MGDEVFSGIHVTEVGFRGIEEVSVD